MFHDSITILYGKPETIFSRDTNFGPAHTTEPPGHKPLVVNRVVVGPFKEEEEGTSIASNAVKVEAVESGHPRSPDLRNDTETAISPISGQQNKATHTHE